MQVVRMVESGALGPTGGPRSVVRLPPGYERLVAGNEAAVTVYEAGGATHVLFVRSRALDGFGGFMNRSDDQAPESPPNAGYWERIVFAEKLRDHWWWVGAGG